MDLRKAQQLLLAAERKLEIASKEVKEGGKVSLKTARQIARLIAAAGAAGASLGALAAAHAEQGVAAANSLGPAGHDAATSIISLAKMMATAHNALETTAVGLGARLLPLADGTPKRDPIETVQTLLAGLL